MLAVMALLMVALAVPAFAAGQGKPEDVPRGQVEQARDHARSICSFSGLNDDPEVTGGQVQSYGQGVRGPEAEKPSGVSGPGDTPGFLCNPEKGPFEGPFPESPEE